MSPVRYFAESCIDPNFLGFPTWYKYLPKTVVNGQCTPSLAKLSDIWLIAAAILDILLRLSALFAVFFIIYGGIQFVLSQGNADQTTKARNTIINALFGLLLAISAAAVVQFVAGSFN